jgi:hypothetical protein
MNIKLINNIILGTLIILSISIIMGIFDFGHGFGDIIFMFPTFIASLVHLFITILASRRNFSFLYLPASIIFGIFLCIILHQGTMGRGHENKWNGKIFNFEGVNKGKYE